MQTCTLILCCATTEQMGRSLGLPWPWQPRHRPATTVATRGITCVITTSTGRTALRNSGGAHDKQKNTECFENKRQDSRAELGRVCVFRARPHLSRRCEPFCEQGGLTQLTRHTRITPSYSHDLWNSPNNNTGRTCCLYNLQHIIRIHLYTATGSRPSTALRHPTPRSYETETQPYPAALQSKGRRTQKPQKMLAWSVDWLSTVVITNNFAKRYWYLQ